MYVRTKNRIYEAESTLRDDGIIKGYNVGEMAFIRKDQVIDQSENLEDLCDEFVVIPKNDWVKNYLSYGVNTKFLKESIYNLNYPIKEVYGAIWTSKGLIYVAKMNESGELELICQK